MHKEIRPSDVQWLAEGWWRYYFKHRTVAKAKMPLAMALVTIVIGGVLLLTGLIANPSNSLEPVDLPSWIIAILAVGGVLLVTAVILFIVASSIERTEEERFVDRILDRWEQGDTDLPDSDEIAEYLKTHDLLA